MDRYFVRVYRLESGLDVSPNAIYETYDQAVASIDEFHSIYPIEYARVEERYAKDIWN